MWFPISIESIRNLSCTSLHYVIFPYLPCLLATAYETLFKLLVSCLSDTHTHKYREHREESVM